MSVIESELGEVTRVGDTVTIVFQRRYARPIEKVWAALTVPERIADWFADVLELDLRVGGRVRLHFPEVQFEIDGVVTALEPPHLLTWAWPQPDGSESSVTFRLERDGDGCRLTLIEAGLLAEQGAGNAAGWHAHLAAIDDACDGVRTPWSRLLEREAAVNQIYKDRAPA
jgi:uncharacterized protein YndB with AHSA1/START domain